MLANRWRNGTRQFSLVSSRVAQSRVDKIEIGDNPITGTVTVANWMFRSTMDGKVQRSIHPVVWVSSIPIRRGQRTRPLAPPWKPFPSVNRVRIHPSGSATTTRTHGWNMDGRKRKWLCSNTCVPEQSEGKGGGCRCWIYVCQRHWFIAESSVSVQRGKRVSHDDQTRPVNELEILEGETWTMRWLGILGWGR